MNTKGLTLGTFDTPHMGHATFLRRAEMFCDPLVVGVNSDRFVKEYKGEAPLFNERERLEQIIGLGYSAGINDGPGAEFIDLIQPAVLIVGSDWATRDYFAQIDTDPADFFGEGMSLVFLPYTPGISTTEIKRRTRA